MALALALGARGLGRVWPNPAVGAVIVQHGRIVGRGWTSDGGRPHAETMALAQAGAAARGATAYVSLEPCSHHGQTPPCVGALLAAGIAKVVSAMEDPDSRVQGRGHAMLRAAGVAVRSGVLAAAAARVHAGFLSRITLGRPFVTLKLAGSLDGRIATATGESRWITAAPARLLVQRLRATHDAVLVGGGTARADDPLLSARLPGVVHPTVRVVASRGLDVSPDGALARSAPDLPLWLLHDASAARAARWQGLGARLLPVPAGPGGLDPVGMMAALAGAGLTRVLCEGGGALAASLLRAGMVDDLVLFSAGVALGADGAAMLAAMGVGALAGAPRFELADVVRVGPDVMQRWRSLP